MRAITAVAQRHNLTIVEDCCQAHLATCEGRPVGSDGAAAAYSFYPTKNLGALGDGGALTTSDPAVAARARRLRNGGQTDKYRHEEFGVNSRLDEMQAAILRVRLPLLRGWTERRRALARRYRDVLGGIDDDCRAARARRRPRVSPLPGAQRRTRRDAVTPASGRRRDAHPLPDSNSAPGRARQRAARRVSDRDARVSRGLVAAALSLARRRRRRDDCGSAGQRPGHGAHRTAEPRISNHEPRTWNPEPGNEHPPRSVFRADSRGAVRHLRGRAAHLGKFGSGTVVPGALRDGPGHRLPSQAACADTLHDERVHRRHCDQR